VTDDQPQRACHTHFTTFVKMLSSAGARQLASGLCRLL
jgi:hypothetical protein